MQSLVKRTSYQDGAIKLLFFGCDNIRACRELDFRRAAKAYWAPLESYDAETGRMAMFALLISDLQDLEHQFCRVLALLTWPLAC